MSAEIKFNARGGVRHTDPDDFALYAMQLLSVEEAAAIAEHIERCVECRNELAAVGGDLASYALSVDAESPSPEARGRLLQQISREKKTAAAPQVIPIAAFGRSGSYLAPVEAPKRSVGRMILGGMGWGIAAGLAVSTAALYRERDALRTDLGAQSGQIAHLTADVAQARAIMQAMTDPEALRVTLALKPPPKPVPQGGATYNAEKGTLVFLANNLEPLELYKTYELWLLPADGTAPIPAGTFRPDAQGNASVILPEIPKGVPAKGFGVTIEPDGGSKTPTLPIVLVGF